MSLLPKVSSAWAMYNLFALFVTPADGTGQALKTLLALAHGTEASEASDTRVKVRRPNKSQSEAVSEDKADEAASSQPCRRTGSGKEQP